MNKYQLKMKASFDKMESIRQNAEKENRAMSVEEITARTGLKTEIESVKAEMESVEAEAKMKLDLFGDGKSQKQSGENEATAKSTKEVYNSFGGQLIDVIKASRNDNTKETREAQARLTEIEAASGAGSSAPSDGGFLIQKDFSTDLTKGVIATGLLANRCFKLPLSANSNGVKLNLLDETNRATGSRFGGIQVYTADEAATVTAKKPKFRQFELNLSKIIGLMYATDELLADSATLESAVMQWFPNEFGFKMDDLIVNGTGAGQPLGILNSGATISVAKETNQAAKTILPENIINMYTRFNGTNGVWFINRDVIPQLYLMSKAVGTGGVPVFMPANMTGVPFNTLLGMPIVEIEQAATLGTTGDIILADMKNYCLIEKGGIQAASSIHVKFIYDEMAFRWTYRVNGKPLIDSPLTPYKGTGNTRSPFVILAVRA